MEESSRGPTRVRAPVAGRSVTGAELAAHEGLVHTVVRRQQRGGLSYADALHAGRLGLWRALGGYDPGRGTRLSSYAVPAIERAVWRAVAEAGAVPAADATGVAGTVTVTAEPGWWEDPVEGLH